MDLGDSSDSTPEPRQNLYELLFGGQSNIFPNEGNSSEKKRKQSIINTPQSEKRRKTDLGAQQQLICYTADSRELMLSGEALYDHLIQKATLLPPDCVLPPLLSYWFISPIELQIRQVNQPLKLWTSAEYKDYYLYLVSAKVEGQAEFYDTSGNFLASVSWRRAGLVSSPLDAFLNSYQRVQDAFSENGSRNLTPQQNKQLTEENNNQYDSSEKSTDMSFSSVPDSFKFLIHNNTSAAPSRTAAAPPPYLIPPPYDDYHGHTPAAFHDDWAPSSYYNSMVTSGLPTQNSSTSSSAHHSVVAPSYLDEEEKRLGTVDVRLNISYSEIKLGEKIGEGGFGVIYLAEWNNQKYAIKRFKFYDVKKEDVIKEAEVLMRLRHKRIVSLIGVTTDLKNDETMLVIEYLENGSLDDLISNGGKLSREDVIQIALDVAEGLHYLHSQKIIHRDLKSANVLLYGHKKRAKLSDFGTVRIFDKSSKATTIIGTLGFMAPEILHEKPYGAKADVYSFGALLYHMLTAKKFPTMFQDATHAITKIKEEVKDPKFHEFIINCCKLDPTERPTIEECIKILQQMNVN